MPAHEPETARGNESPLQPMVLRLVAFVAALLIVIPILPMLASNLAYSFSGQSPKIYWYLSRSGGFVTLTVLWASMAMGLAITNKMARLWPGAPVAFSVHQYTSLLGLFFAAYHGLVLMGDHYTEFSLPRLVTPFSIEYKTLWIGLGQTSFYLWLVVVVSFYIRPYIGQKTWRLIHYVNFATYAMGFAHSLMSGTDSDTGWARSYFWISGASLVLLLAYRIYDSLLKNRISLPAFRSKRASRPTDPVPASPKIRNVPEALLREQALKPATQAAPPVAAQAVSEEKAPQPVSRPEAAQETPAAGMEKKAASPSPVVHIQQDGKEKVRVRIFREPTTMPIPELQEMLQGEIKNLFARVRRNFYTMPVEPLSPGLRAERVLVPDE